MPQCLNAQLLHYDHFNVYSRQSVLAVWTPKLWGETDMTFKFKTDALTIVDAYGNRDVKGKKIENANGFCFEATLKNEEKRLLYVYYKDSNRLKCIFQADGYWWMVVYNDHYYLQKTNSYKQKLAKLYQLNNL